MSTPPAGTAQPETDVCVITNPEQPEVNRTLPPHLELAAPQLQVEQLRVSVKPS